MQCDENANLIRCNVFKVLSGCLAECLINLPVLCLLQSPCNQLQLPMSNARQMSNLAGARALGNA